MPSTGSAPDRRDDPWVEQERRSARHRAVRRARRAKRTLTATCVVGAIATAIAIFVAAVVGPTRDSSPPSTPTTTVDARGGPVTSATPDTTLPPDRLLGVEEVWLIDRDARIYDWGVVVRPPDGAATRSGVDVEVRLIDADDDLVETISVTLDAVGDTGPGVAAGRLADPASPPVRLEFDLVIGEASDDRPLAELLELVALDRSEDRLSGRIRTSGAAETTGFGALFVWRDDVGDVVAAVPFDVERVRPGVDARFELDLGDEPVPDGLPDDVFWTG